jgi:UDP-glucose 4-epimerase
MKALVTGGAGFIGSHMCEMLIQQNIDVVVVDNLSTGRFENIAHLGDRVKFVHSDLRVADGEWVKETAGCDYIFICKLSAKL